jgi:ABC-type dipeptide/oligopeptide/nickel transport system permease subunit
MRQHALSTWQKFKKNYLALGGLIFIVLLFLVSISGYLFLPDKTVATNNMQLSLALKKPGFSVDIFTLPNPNSVEEGFWMFSGKSQLKEEIPVDSFYQKSDSLFYKPYTTSRSGLWTSIKIDKNSFVLTNAIQSRTYWLGTDRFGRDQLSRLMLGARVSLAVGAIAVIISLIIGVTLGLLGGYFGGWVDAAVMWLINVIWSLPTLLIVVSMSLALGKGFWQIFVAVGLSMWVELARMVRGQVKSVKELEYVQAAQVLGFSHVRIMFKHILPNIIGPVIVICAANFASAILLEAGLSFLGLGVQPPMPSWGMMIKEHYSFIVFNAAHLAVFPGLAIMFTVMAFNFIGVGLRDAFDVRD